MIKKFNADIDIDLGNRDMLLKHIPHIPASIYRDDEWTKHNSGIYVNPIPFDPVTGTANIDYIEAEQLGYIKIDALNMYLYSQIDSEEQLIRLMHTEPNWNRLRSDRTFFEKIIHISNHYDLMMKMPEPINSITRMAMFLAVIRPAKRHLAGLTWKDVAKTVWDKVDDGGYGFKNSHAIGYSHLVVVNMNLITERGE